MFRLIIQSKKQKLAAFTLLVCLVIGGVFWYANLAAGATYTWDGGGGDGLWSTCTNWTSDTCPGASDIAQFTSANTTNSTVDASFAGSVLGISVTSGYTGTITQQRNLTIGSSGFSQAGGTWVQNTTTFDINNGSLSITGGTFLAGAGTSYIERNITITGTYTASSTRVLVMNGNGTEAGDDSTLSCSGQLNGTFNVSKVYSNQSFVFASGCEATTSGSISTPIESFTVNGTMHVAGDVSLTGGPFTNNGTTTLSGTSFMLTRNFTQNGVFDLTGIILTLDGNGTDAGDDTTLTCTGDLGGSIAITKSYTNQSFTLASGCNATTSSSITTSIESLNVYGTLHINGNIDLTDGSLTGSGIITMSGTSVILDRNFTKLTGFDMTGIVLTFDGDGTDANDDSTFTCSGSFEGTINVTKSSSNQSFVLASGCHVTTSGAISTGIETITINGEIDFAGNVTLDEGSFVNNGTSTMTGTTFTVDRNFTQNGVFNLSGKTINFLGDGTDANDDSTLTCSGSLGGTIDVSKVHSSQSFVLASGCSVVATTITTAGSLTINGTLATGGNTLTGSSLTINAGATLRRYGNETVTTPTIGENAIIDYYGPGTYSTLGTGFTDFEHIRFSGGGTYNLTGTYTIEDDFQSTNGSNFNQTSGTVTFDGKGDQTITGTSTFANLTATTSTGARWLNFGSNQTTTVTGTATLTGYSYDYPLKIGANEVQTAWKFNPQSGRDFQNLWVRDSNNINATAAECTRCRNLDGNTNWNLGEPRDRLRVGGNTRLQGGIRFAPNQ